MRSEEVHRTFREAMSPRFRERGFSRAKGSLSGWRRGPLLVWFQCHPRGWDPYAGSSVFVNLQKGMTDRAWDRHVTRLQEALTDAELDERLALENRVVLKRRLPPREFVAQLHAHFARHDPARADDIVRACLATFAPSPGPILRHHDHPLACYDADDIRMWSAFLMAVLPRIVGAQA